MLNAHSSLAIPEEMLYFRSHFGHARIEDWRAPSISEEDYTKVVEDFVSRVSELHPELDADALFNQILSEPKRDLRHPFLTVMSDGTKKYGKVRWGEKTPGNLFYVDIMREMFPEACFVYMVRDPRAGVASMNRASFFPDDAVLNALTRRKHARVGLKLLRKHVPEKQWLTTRYEDLVQNPEEELHRICDMIGERYEPEMLSYHDSAAHYMKAEASQSFNAAATKPVTTSKIRRWRDELAPFQIAAIERICRDEMNRHSYKPLKLSLPVLEKLRLYVKIVLWELYWDLQMWRHQDVRHYTVKHEIFARSRRRIEEITQFFGKSASSSKNSSC